jgi:hypothetical protein
MQTSDYRRDYAAYAAALERARYDFHTGASLELRLAPLQDRYADLWTISSIDDLTRAREEASTQFEIERTALAALLRAAQLGYLEARAAEVTGELARCCASARFEREGVTFAADDGHDVLAAEPDATRRRELSARWFDSLRTCDDLRAARLDALREAARSLGFNSYFAFVSGIQSDSDGERLSVGAAAFLERSAPHYHAKLSEWSAGHLPADFARTPVYADSLRLVQLPHLEFYFHGGYLRRTYEATISDLGIRPTRQPNLIVEATANDLQHTPARCFALNPPEDVRLVYDETSGVSCYQTFFEAAGRAQHFAWVSRDLAARYPELVHATDETTRVGFGLLFGDLLKDAGWLAANRQVRPSVASEITHSIAFVELYRTRRACVRLRQQRVLDEAIDPLSEHLAAAYTTALEEATGFRAHPALYLRDLIPTGLYDTRGGEDSSEISPVVYLRARLFATSLGEYLRTRHGRRWWSTRGAADELIDMWNTGSRYTVEELASLVGLGAPDFDLLADSTERSLTGE